MLAVFIAFMGAASPARANFFSDNEARRAILDLRQRYLALSEENGKLRESLQTTQTQLEALRSDVTRVRNREEQLTRDVADLQRRLNQATTEDNAAPVQTLKEYPLVSSNRVMEGQITYFDGPMLGLLVQARPVK